MEMTPENYDNIKAHTVWGSVEWESRVAIFAKDYARGKNFDSTAVCSSITALLLAGGKSGEVRDPANLDVTMARARASFPLGSKRVPEFSAAFPPSPLMKAILQE